jgi:hypothetical protein
MTQHLMALANHADMQGICFWCADDFDTVASNEWGMFNGASPRTDITVPFSAGITSVFPRPQRRQFAGNPRFNQHSRWGY